MDNEYSLIGINGNAYSVMGYVSSCMRKEGKSAEEIISYTTEAKSSDYDNLLRVSADVIDTLNKE